LVRAVRWRYLGTTPLAEGNALRWPAVSIVNGRIGYNGWTTRLDVINMLNAKTNE
jgi:hypothetical protein